MTRCRPHGYCFLLLQSWIYHAFIGVFFCTAVVLLHLRRPVRSVLFCEEDTDSTVQALPRYGVGGSGLRCSCWWVPLAVVNLAPVRTVCIGHFLFAFQTKCLTSGLPSVCETEEKRQVRGSNANPWGLGRAARMACSVCV
ncbi:unnamed protein product [Scytosiphon promiscuus]